VSSALVLAVAVAAGSVAVLRGDHTSLAKGTTSVRLVDYSGDIDGSGLRQVVDCLRGQGFDVPDPTQTGPGWEIQIPDSIDTMSPAWREAAFVTCRPLPQSAPGQFYSAPDQLETRFGDQSSEQAFVSCMHDQGYDLPTPTDEGQGGYVFDLRQSGIDTSTDQWYRALTIACSPPSRPREGSSSLEGR